MPHTLVFLRKIIGLVTFELLWYLTSLTALYVAFWVYLSAIDIFLCITNRRGKKTRVVKKCILYVLIYIWSPFCCTGNCCEGVFYVLTSENL